MHRRIGVPLDHTTPASPKPRFDGHKSAPDARHKTMDDFWKAQGWHKRTRLGLKFVRAKWERKPKLRKEAVRFLVEEVLRKDPRDVTKEDFVRNRLHGLLNNYYGASPYKALWAAGYRMNPWEMLETPKHFYESVKNRAKATRWLVAKMRAEGKALRRISQSDFNANRLGGMLNDHHHGKAHDALVEAGYRIHRAEMRTNGRYYGLKENRVAEARWLAKRVEKEDGRKPRDITANDFRRHHRSGLLNGRYHNHPYEAVLEAGLVTQADEAYMRQTGIRRLKQAQREI